MSHLKIIRAGCLLAAACVLLTTGCATHTANAGMAMAKLKAGDTASALKWSEKLKKSSRSGDLGFLESGRIKMLAGDFSGSRADFETAIGQVLEETETGPVIRVGSAGSTIAASTFADDKIRKYELSPYEVIQLLHYQTLNYLFSGDPDGASVEMRRTVFAQDAIAEKYSGEVEDHQSEADETQAKALEAVNAKMETMGPVLERTRSSHENGLAWYFCGLMFEKQGDLSNATLCYRKAWELAPKNPSIVKDFLRLLQTQDRQAFLNLALKNNMDVKSLTRGSTEIVLLYEDALISQRYAEKIPFPIPDFEGTITLVSIDFPFYSDSVYMPSAIAITDNGAELGFAEPAVYLQSLAYRDLKEKIPGVVIRNVTRAVTKIAAQQVANQGSNYTKYGMMAFNAATSLSSTSDTRAWYSIPMATHVYRGSVSAGEHTLQCRNPASGMTVEIQVAVSEGETRVVWIADTGGIAVAATASLSGKGLPPTYQQFNAIFYTNEMPLAADQPATISSEVESVTREKSEETVL
jgi:hypothetical protein